MVVAEHTVDTGGQSPVGHLERLLGSVPERRHDDAGTDHSPVGADFHCRPPARPPSAAPTAPAALSEHSGDDDRPGSGRPTLDQFGVRPPGGIEEEIPRTDQTPSQNEAFGVEHARQVGQSEPDPPTDLFDHAPRIGISREGGRGDILAADAFGITPRAGNDPR